MAVTYENKGLDLRGTSQDDKPTNVPVNTKFHELDTNDEYYFTGEAWAKVGGDNEQTA